ncbi:MAG TPA: MEDS domain-containing protein [Solirubrobacteraceae bacterium]|jgi:hypothetical protein
MPVDCGVAERGEHVVQFYENDAELIAAVGPYLLDALNAGEVAIAIATDVHRELIDTALARAGVDVPAARADGSLLLLDAAETMRPFVLDGQIAQDAFEATVGKHLRRACASGRHVRAYGEMVALLWEEGNVLGAIDLEQAWNDLAAKLTFDLFCAYPAAATAGPDQAQALHRVCALHSAVVPAPPRGVQELCESFAADPCAPGQARRLLRSALREWGHAGEPVDDAVLVLGELASNAVRHARSSFSMVVRMESSALRLAVGDDQATRVGAEQGMVAKPTHGLAVVDALAERWGIEDAGAGKIVWAELALPS